MHGYIAFQIIGGYRKCQHECSLGVNLVIDNVLYVAIATLPLYQILEQSNNYLYMEILHFKDLGNSVVNAVVLVLE